MTMRHKVWYDEEHKLGRIRLGGSSSYEEAAELLEGIHNVLDGRNRRDMLVDISARTGETPSKEIRKLYKEKARALNLGKVAIIGLKPIVRMAAKVIIIATGKANETRFFKSEDEALNWLKKDTTAKVTSG